MDCGRCGAELEETGDFAWQDGDEVECSECGSVSTITVDDENEEVYVSSWVCAHGFAEDETCDDCGSEEALRGM